MKRRSVLLGAHAVAVDCAFSQRLAAQPPRKRVGSLNTGTFAPNARAVEAFSRGIATLGYVEGRNLEFDHMWANEQYDRLPEMAAQLVSRNVDVIVTSSVPLSARIAMNATRTIPIVFATNSDPVEAGLVPNLARPGGNATGIFYPIASLYSKRIELLSQLVPTARKVAMLINPNAPLSSRVLDELRQAAGARQMELAILEATNETEIDKAFSTAAGPPLMPVFIQLDQIFNRFASQTVAAANQYRVPVVHAFPRNGGLMSYSFDGPAAYHDVGVYVGRILNGAKPADLPVQQVAKFQIVLNMTVAQAQGIVFPLSIQAAATEIIQ